MPLPRNSAGRRFLALWTVSAVIKIAALAAFLALLLALPGAPKL